MSPRHENLHPSDRESPECGRTHPLEFSPARRPARLLARERGLHTAQTRGFTVLEVSIAVSLFLVIASVLTLSLARSTAVNVSARLHRQLDARVASLLDQVAGDPYDSLLADQFAVPAGDTSVPECADLPIGATGSTGASCLLVGTRAYGVRYQVSPATDASGVVGDSVQITATVRDAGGTTRSDDPVLTDGGTSGSLSVVRRVSAPVAGYQSGNGGIVRVLVHDTRAPVGGTRPRIPLYLLTLPAPDGSATSQAVGEIPPDSLGTPTAQKIVLLRLGAGATCSRPAPCVLGLRTPVAASPGYRENSTAGLAPDAADSSATLALNKDGLAQETVTVFDKGSLHLSLVAQSDEGATGAPPAAAAGSVCLWATFRDGAALQRVPACNFADPTAVSFDHYQPANPPGGSPATFPIPVGVPLTLSTDAPDHSCPLVSNPGTMGPANSVGSVRTGANTSGWTASAVCTGYTWGTASSLTVVNGATGVAFEGASVSLSGGTLSQGTAIWSGKYARPATGVLGEDLWASPREAAGCATASSASCTSFGTQYDPEDTECPPTDFHCTSVAGAPPHLRAPASPFTVYTTGGSATFPLRAIDSSRGATTYSVKAVSVPSAGAVTCGTTLLTAGTVINPSVPAGVEQPVANCTYTGGGGVQALRLALRDNLGLQSTVDIALLASGSDQPFHLRGSAVRLAQGGSAQVSVSVVDTAGKPAANGASVTFTAPAGSKLTFSPATAPTMSGVATATVTADPTSPAGAVALQATAADGRSTATEPDGAFFTATITQSIRQIALTAPTTLTQGGKAPLGLVATDANGIRVPGRDVAVAVLEGTSVGPGTTVSARVFPQYAGCETDAQGSCNVMVLADRNAQSSASAGGAAYYYLAAQASGIPVVTQPLSVGPTPTALTLNTLARVPQGSSTPTTFAVILRDGAGNPLANQTLTPQGSAGTLTPSGGNVITDSTGLATLSYTAPATAPQGPTQGRVQVGSISIAFPARILGVPTKIVQAPGATTPTLNAGGSGSILMLVTDANGAPVSDEALAFTFAPGAPAGLQIGASASSNSAGQVVTPVSATSDVPPGSYTASVADPALPAFGPVSVSVTVGAPTPCTAPC